MWFIFTLITFFAWGAADLFYKKGADAGDRYSHLKTSVAVGLVMGVTAVVTLITKDIDYDPINIIRYLPVSAMYILSMVIGYLGLRYLELSVSSPVQNASGAVAAVLLIIFLHEMPDTVSLIAIIIITVGVVLLGVFERGESIYENKKYRFGITAFSLPVLYCVIDSLGTFLDGYYLDDPASTPLLGVTAENIEDVANISYQFTFLIAAVIIAIYVFVIKKEKPELRAQKDRFFAALLETAGQLAYVYALSGNGVVAAPVIAAYCVASVLFARIFLREKLPRKQYIAVGLVFIGIIILGIVEGLG